MQETKDLAPFELERRLIEEINILKLEGSLFCFDPKEAKAPGREAHACRRAQAAREHSDRPRLRTAVRARVQGAAGDLPEGRGDRVLDLGGWALPVRRHRVVQRARARSARRPLMGRENLGGAPPGDHAASPHQIIRIALRQGNRRVGGRSTSRCSPPPTSRARVRRSAGARCSCIRRSSRASTADTSRPSTLHRLQLARHHRSGFVQARSFSTFRT